MKGKLMQLINLTPHNVRIYFSDDAGTTAQYDDFPATGQLARCAETVTRLGYIADGDMGSGLVVVRVSHGDVTVDGDAFPAPQDGVGYIVSAMVANALRGRRDVFSPHGLIRDDKGIVVGCSGLAVASSA